MRRYRYLSSFKLINRSDWRMLTSQSLSNHGPDVFYWRGIWFVVDHIIEDAPVCDAASREAESMGSELRVHAAAKIVELFVYTLVVLNTTPILDSGLVMWLHDPLRSCGQHACFSAASDRGWLSFSTTFRITVLIPSIPYSANSHWILTNESSNTAIR
ncbi:hypothetical protein TNCV_1008071 [Trichonephila clavipes]|nr:hypothetical protein TNCV_1008071 [Trichonephila clavipes]